MEHGYVLKAIRRIHGTLHNLSKQPPSVDGGNGLTIGETC